MEHDVVIRFEAASKSFGDNIVLQDFNLDIRRSERIALIGPSGSGKTTILRLLMTLDRPDKGSVYLDGESIWEMPRRGRLVPADQRHLRRMRSKAGIVFQQFNLFPHMTVLRNVAEAPVRVLGRPRTEAEERARELLRTVGLHDKDDAYPAQLSGGQQQRVAIARALAKEPSVMLFDEVTSALDPELVGEVLKVLRDLAERTDMTMLFVTHEMRFAREVADRVVMFDKGVVVEAGEPDKLLRNPDHERTRAFLHALLDH
jgi:polar amino acid transport system ATP-binding protein